MAIVVNIYYTGKNGSAKKFVEEMESKGIADSIRSKKGNLKYDYFYSYKDDETVLLVDSWENQEALDIHHQSEMMLEIINLREKYDLKMKVERYIPNDIPEHDIKFIKE